jgi:hypothetical protein
MEREVINKHLELFFENQIQSVHFIQTTETKALVLVELDSTYLIVTVSDHTSLPIGDFDVYIDLRVDKTNHPVADMAKMIELIQLDIEKGLKTHHEKVLEMTGELAELSKAFSKTSVLSLK